ncbi:SulP family inorganic anion transporter [Paenibacillus montanisoli]|uniref:Sodium-independent anion transporter n=1 Tax=Paenibacillus montanisoli TaxID=2081970 RepID=A0A328U6D5_9BACL|nr:SulP family inorganic anion transporter [Paenibacillus montanisoli]RAP78120.1 sodium-independent anion transporter [Paenibacillus montanisoli]
MKWSGRFEGYRLESLRRDIVSGLIVGIVAIPLAMSFAIASGVNPQFGIYTTVIAGFLISLLGGSKFQIGGPTGAFIPILLGIVLQYGYEKLLIAGMLAGVMLVLMGIFKLGVLIQFIPRPVTIGFTAGIAVIIFSGQISNFLGLRGIERHDDFLSNLGEILSHLSTINMYSVATAFICLIIMLLMPRYLPKVPASLLGLLISTIVSVLFFHGKVTTIGSAYGSIPSSFPVLVIPHLTFETVIQLLQPAFVIAMLGGIESLLSAVVADGMTGTKHNSNRELIGQGIANLAAPLFGGIPATGAIARTATNIKSGAASPVSGMVHGVAVLLILLLFAPLASDIPLAAMAPILMVVAWNMSERKHFVQVLRLKTSDSLIMAATFLLTVLTNLTTAVELGLLMAAIIFVYRMRSALTVTRVQLDQRSSQISIITIEGPLFFGAASRFEELFKPSMPPKPNVTILQMAGVPFIDSTGEHKLDMIVDRIHRDGGSVVLAGIQKQPLQLLQASGLALKIGEANIVEHPDEALHVAIHRKDTGK